MPEAPCRSLGCRDLALCLRCGPQLSLREQGATGATGGAGLIAFSARGRGCLDTTSLRGRPSERILARGFSRPARFAAGEPAKPGQAEGVWPLSRLPRLWNLQPRAAPPPCPRHPAALSACRDLALCLRCGPPTLAQGATGATGGAGLIAFSARGRGCLDTTSLRGRPSERILARGFSRAGQIATRRPSTQVNHCLWSLMRARGQLPLTAVQPL